MIYAEASDKKAKSAVDYEHPAQGPHHCGECRYFEVRGPRQCLKVKGVIRSEDWCRLFKQKS